MRASWGHSISLRKRQHQLAGWVVGASLLACGCAVDDRTLSQSPGSGATSSRAGTSPSDAGHAGLSSSGSGGSGSQAMPGDEMLPVCIYDDPDGVGPECATLAKNAGFQSGTQPWSPDPGSGAGWVPDDAAASEHSGSLKLLNYLPGEDDGIAPCAAAQCLAAAENHVYDFAGDIFIKDGQAQGLHGDESFEATAGLSIYFFPSADCTGPNYGNVDSPVTAEVESWIHVEGSGRAPEQTQSMKVRLNTLKPFRQHSFEARFDNIFVRER